MHRTLGYSMTDRAGKKRRGASSASEEPRDKVEKLVQPAGLQGNCQTPCPSTTSYVLSCSANENQKKKKIKEIANFMLTSTLRSFYTERLRLRPLLTFAIV